MNSPGTQLSDLLYALQIKVKVMEELITSTRIGTRPETDFKWRFLNQAYSLADDLKKIKPLVDSMLQEGNVLISPVSLDPAKSLLSFKC